MQTTIRSHEIKLAHAFTSDAPYRKALQYIQITPTNLIATDSYKVIFVDRAETPSSFDGSGVEYLGPTLAGIIAKATTKKNAHDNFAGIPAATITEEELQESFPACEQLIKEWEDKPNSTNEQGDMFSVSQLLELFTALHQNNKLTAGRDRVKIKIMHDPKYNSHILSFNTDNSKGFLMGCAN